MKIRFIVLLMACLLLGGVTLAQSNVAIKGSTTTPTIDSVCYSPEVRVIADTGGVWRCSYANGAYTWTQPKVEVLAHLLIPTVTALDAFVFRMPPFIATVTGVYCSIEAGTNAVIEICAEDNITGTCTTDVITPDPFQLTCSAGTGVSDTSPGGNPTASLDQYTVYIVSVSGATTNLDITLIGVRN